MKIFDSTMSGLKKSYRKRAEKISSVNKINFSIILILFLGGFILQIIGIFFDYFEPLVG